MRIRTQLDHQLPDVMDKEGKNGADMLTRIHHVLAGIKPFLAIAVTRACSGQSFLIQLVRAMMSTPVFAGRAVKNAEMITHFCGPAGPTKADTRNEEPWVVAGGGEEPS